MEKIIEPISYRKMTEKYTKPAFSYRLKEGPGAGYTFTLLGLNIQNVKVKNVKEESDQWGNYGEWKSGEFEADIVPGEYDWEAEHPYWYLKSPDNTASVEVTGGKVYGWFTDILNKDTDEAIGNEISYNDTYDVQAIVGGGWSHTDMKSPWEITEEDRGSYTTNIDVTVGDHNYGYITKASIDLDEEWINDCIYDAMHPEEDIFNGGYEDDDDLEEEDEEDEEEVITAGDARHPNFAESKSRKVRERHHTWSDYEGTILVDSPEDRAALMSYIRKHTDDLLDGHVDEAEPMENWYVPENKTDEETFGNSILVRGSTDRNIYDLQADLWEELEKATGIGIEDIDLEYTGYTDTYDESRKSKGKKFKESYYANIEDYLMNRKGSTISFDDLLKAYKAKFGDVPTYKVGWDVYNFLGDHIDQTAFLDDVCNDYGYSDAWVYSDDAANIMQDKMDDLASKIDDRLAESKKFKGKKFKEDAFTSRVRQDVLEVSAAKKQVDADVDALDKKVNTVTNDIVQIALNHRPTIKEAQTRFVELDSSLNVSKDGQISENDAKKILRRLAADKNLRANASYSVKDADGKVTYWDFLKSQDPNYQYVFVMEMTGGYNWCNMLFLNKKRGKVDMKNTLWDSYNTEGYERVYDKEEVLHESNRLTHKIVLKPENSGFRLTYADKLKFHSLEDAQRKLDDLNFQIGARLASKGLHLEIEEIPQSTKPRNTRTSDPDYENPFEVGDILEGDFGWSMILPVWVEVISKTNKMVTVRRLKSKVISHDGYGQAGTKMPIPGQYETDWNGDYREKKCLVKKGYNRTPDSDSKKNYIIEYEGKPFRIWDGEASDFDTYD